MIGSLSTLVDTLGGSIGTVLGAGLGSMTDVLNTGLDALATGSGNPPEPGK
jgi:hypothetical protein